MDILDKYVRRGRRTASRIWGKTAVVMILPVGRSNMKKELLELTPTGTLIWKLLENKPKLRELVDSFARKKRIKRNIATKEIVKFIKNLAAREIVDILDNPEQE